MRSLWWWGGTISPASLLVLQVYNALPRAAALIATLTPAAYSRRLDRSGSHKLFQSLDMNDWGTMASLLRLQLGIDNDLRFDFLSFKPSKMQAHLMVAIFVNYPKIHPYVLPFGQFAASEALNFALDPYLERYHPEVVGMYDEWEATSEQDLFLSSSQLKRILDQVADPVKIVEGDTIISMAYDMDFPEMCDLTSFEVSQESYRLRSGIWKPTVAAISLLFDAVRHYNFVSMFEQCKRLEHSPLLAEPVIEAIKNYRKDSIEWIHSYRLLLKELQMDLLDKPAWIVALWEAKLLVCAISLETICQLEKELLFVDYLRRNSIHNVPVEMLALLKHVMAEEEICISITRYPDMAPFLRIIDRLIPRGRPIWGGLSRFIDHWHSVLRLTSPVLPVELPSKLIFNIEELVQWWGDPNSLAQSLLVDPTAFPAIEVRGLGESDADSNPHCSSFEQFLEVMTEYLSHIAGVPHLQTIIRVAVTRTIACNLLYRYLVTTRLNTDWINSLNHDLLHFDGEPHRLHDFVAYHLWINQAHLLPVYLLEAAITS